MLEQNYETKSQRIRTAFAKLKQSQPKKLEKRLNLSWCNCFSGIEPMEEQAHRLKKAGIDYIELRGIRSGPELGYDPKVLADILHSEGIQVSGIVALSSERADLSSNDSLYRNTAIDNLKRELEFAKTVGAHYIDIIPSAIGRPVPYDKSDFERSVESVRQVADLFVEYGIKGAIEPINSFEVSLIHSLSDAKRFISALDHPGVSSINGDLFHLQLSENHIGEAIMDAGSQLVNLHIADSNRDAIGQGSLDIDTIIMALYLIGFNEEGRFVTGEPLGTGRDPVEAIFGKGDKMITDRLVSQTATYFRKREEQLLL